MSNLLYFERREVKPYAEPVSGHELRIGNLYFQLNYTSNDLLIPTMRTVVFIGRNLYDGEVGDVYFQDIKSYLKGEHYDLSEEAQIIQMPEDQTDDVFEYERALDSWLHCELRRNRPVAPMHSISSDTRHMEAEDDESKVDPIPTEVLEYIRAHPYLKDDKEGLAQFIVDMSPLVFDGRDLPAQPHTVNINELMAGETYFFLEYADNDKQIPVMDTVVFIGENIGDRDQNELYFEDASSYQETVDYKDSEAPEWPQGFVKLQNELDSVFTFNHVLEELMRCSLRRNIRVP